MRIIKTCKYALSEESLEEDINKFMRDAKDGAYQYDYKYGQEGLKIIKAYFRIIEDEFKNQNHAVARACYKKLMFFLLQTEYNYFDYEDIVGKLNFEKFVTNYFICLIKLCSVDELFKEYIEYLKASEDYWFESADKTILTGLSEEGKEKFISMIEKESETVGEEDYAMHDLIYFQLDLAKEKKDRNKYDSLCEKYEKIVGKEQKGEFEP